MTDRPPTEFDAIAARLMASLPPPPPAPPPEDPAAVRRRWLGDRAQVLIDGRFSTEAVEVVRADAMFATPALDHARRYRAMMPGVPPTILVLLGGTGSGKTAAAAWLASEVGGSRPGLVRAGQLERAGRYDREMADWIEARTLVVIDDLGVEFQDGKGAFRSILDELVDVAYSFRKRLVITANLDRQGLADRVGARIWSRFCADADIAECGAVDLRRGR